MNFLVFGLVIRLMLFYSKKIVANLEDSKWRSNSRWTPKQFYRLKLVNYIFLQIFFLDYLNLANFSFLIKKTFS
jgi:hypothetical protein